MADTVDVAPAASVVPESAAHAHCTVVGPQVIVTVIRGEHHTGLPPECITGVAQVSRHVKLVVMRLPGYIERTVLGVVPAEITCLEVHSQLVRPA